MNFDFSDEQTELRHQAQRVLCNGVQRARAQATCGWTAMCPSSRFRSKALRLAHPSGAFFQDVNGAGGFVKTHHATAVFDYADAGVFGLTGKRFATQLQAGFINH